MVMPFGTKSTLAPPESKAPAKIDFNALWENAFAPAIRQLGYEPVRADQDVGALIIQEMLERLAISDLVIADMTIPNANVYYEIGIRHAARGTGCVLVSADWARPLFDTEQMRRITFPLPHQVVNAKTAKLIQDVLCESIPKFKEGKTPPFAAIPGFPSAISPERCGSFKSLVRSLSVFQAEVAAVRCAPPSQRASRALELRRRYGSGLQGTPAVLQVVPSVAMELLYLLRDCTDWQTTLAYLDTLPEQLRNLPVVQEQRALAVSKSGSHFDAIGALQELIRLQGPTSEREGLLGGRYKKLWAEAREARDQQEAPLYLGRAIEHYEAGMNLDLNDYYPSSNLPRLLRTRGATGDEEKSAATAYIARAAAERARERNPADEWALLALLGAAFDLGDVPAAEGLYAEIRNEGMAVWKLETTLSDLKLSSDLLHDAAKKDGLGRVLAQVEAQVAQKPSPSGAGGGAAS
jgi:hypothetical protein